MASLLDFLQNPANTQMLLGTAAGLLGTPGNARQQFAGGLLGGLHGAQVGAQLQQARAAEEFRRYQLEALKRKEEQDQKTQAAYASLFTPSAPPASGVMYGQRPTPANALAMQQGAPLQGMGASGMPPGVPFGVPPGVPFGVPPGVPFGVPPGVPSGGPSGPLPGVLAGMPPGGRPPMPTQAMPQGAPQAMPQGSPGLFAGMDPKTVQFLQSVPASVGFPLLANHLAPKPVEPKVVGNALVDPKTGKTIYQAPQDWQNPEYQKWILAKTAAGRPQTNVTVSGEKKGAEVMYQKGAEAYSTAQGAERDANRREVYYTGLSNAMKGFTPGATAELRLRLGGIAKDLGIDVAGIPEGQEFQAISSGLELAFAPKGQGAITENEREIIRRGIPNIAQTPDGVMRVIEAGRRLDEHDRKVAKIFRDNARKNGGTVNPVEVDEELSKLGPVMSQGELNFFAGTKGAASSPSGAAKQGQPAPKSAGVSGTTGSGVKWQVE